jgi:hypothetical protein
LPADLLQRPYESDSAFRVVVHCCPSVSRDSIVSQVEGA